MFSKQIYLKLKIKKIKIMTLDPKKKNALYTCKEASSYISYL